MNRWFKLLRVIFRQSAPVRAGFWTVVAMLDRVEPQPRCGIKVELWIMDEASSYGSRGGTYPLDERGDRYIPRPFYWTPSSTTTVIGPP